MTITNESMQFNSILGFELKGLWFTATHSYAPEFGNGSLPFGLTDYEAESQTISAIPTIHRYR